MRSKLGILVGLVSFLVLMIGMVASRSEEPIPETAVTQQEAEFKVRSAIIPDQLTFAGEPVPLDDWNVRERLERELLINTYWQSNTLLMIKRTRRYFDRIEKVLKQQNVPTDFKYLALAESGLQNTQSPAGAEGMWQFIESTGESYGLKITSEIDQRYDLEKATAAAAAYLTKCKDDLGNWTNAAAAFNRGRNGLRRDINKQKDSSFYRLYLNTETSRYVFRILALKLICEQPATYGFDITDADYYLPVPSYTVKVDTTIHSLVDFAQQHGTTYRDVKLLNPWLRDDHLTIVRDTMYIRLPELLAEGVDEQH